MKKLRLTFLSVFVLVAITVFQNCGGETEETAKEITTNILTSKEWVVNSVNVPSNTATIGDDWANFSMSFSATNITTNNHASGAQAVWPSGSYTVSEDGKSITRHDDVVITLSPISETSFAAIFTVPAGTETGGRIAALEGGYTFNMK